MILDETRYQADPAESIERRLTRLEGIEAAASPALEDPLADARACPEAEHVIGANLDEQVEEAVRTDEGAGELRRRLGQAREAFTDAYRRARE